MASVWRVVLQQSVIRQAWQLESTAFTMSIEEMLERLLKCLWKWHFKGAQERETLWKYYSDKYGITITLQK